MFKISIHALLAESDFLPPCGYLRPYDFNPRSPRGERPDEIALAIYRKIISIHALLAESDSFPPFFVHIVKISIHALLAESDPEGLQVCTDCMKFQSTLSSRRATLWRLKGLWVKRNFNPRSPRGERPVTHVSEQWWIFISIHALLAESDLHLWGYTGRAYAFQSTLSSRRAT